MSGKFTRFIAESVFKAFLEGDELDKTEVSVHLLYERTVLAVYRFDAAQGTLENWKGRVVEIAWPEGQGQIGRPTKLEGGARHNVCLDSASIVRARKLGKGNISEGIRIALSCI